MKMRHFLTHTEFKRGLRESLPIMLGAVPFALILGAQARQKGMSALETVMMMGLNFAGGSEFAAVNLWTSPLPVLLIIATTAMINSRHILMGAAMAPLLRHLPLRKVLPALFMMTDESWAMGIADSQKHAQKQPARLNYEYYMGTAASLYAVWVCCGAPLASQPVGGSLHLSGGTEHGLVRCRRLVGRAGLCLFRFGQRSGT